jgi:cytochrome c oxidase cbb3-type subunit 3
MFNIKQYYFMKRLLFTAAILCTSQFVFAQQAASSATPPTSVWQNPLALAMLAIALVLLLVIALLANVVLGTASWFTGKQKEHATNKAKLITGVMLLASPFAATAQNTAAAAGSSETFSGLSATTFFLLLAVIGVELIVIIVLAFFVKSFLAKEKPAAVAVQGAADERKPSGFKNLWDQLNRFRPVTEEAKIDLGHEYDGIRELNNRLPPWWLYGFYATILFSVIYLWRYHVSHSAPLSGEELKIALQKGEEEKAAYLAKAANNVDENTVAFIKDPAALQSGEAIFKQTCKTCHGEKGEGNQVGPNLTDDYWLHGGSIKDIFKTIKYGYTEKGMQSWKDQYSPVQIAQLASYIQSIKGSNPPNARAPQGDLYKENASPAKDSAAADTGKDSTATAEIKTTPAN